MFVVPNIFRLAGSIEEQEICRNARVGSEDTIGETNDGMEVEVFEQFFLDAGTDAVAEEDAVGNDDAGAAWLAGRRSLRIMSWRKSKAVSEACLSSGKLERMPRSSSPPKRGFVRITSTRSRSPISFNGKRRLLRGSILGVSKPCKSRFICASR